jgi:3-hydroxyacyl-CoA dehydrogenase
MGSRIAAHFANTGVPVLLLDVVSPGTPDRNATAVRGIDSALKQRPGAFFTAERTALISPGNFEDDLGKIGECDWIVEAVVENLDVKRALWRKVAGVRSNGSIVSTNTSGIPLARIAEGFSEEFRRHFLGTHFFNPPRFLHLVEMIPGVATDPEVLRFTADFCDRRLGKGVVLCKDTPNFIANRIGSFFGATACKIMVEDGYTVEEVDALTGPLIGLPNSATFRLFDLVGLDVWALVFGNVYQLAPDDPWRERFVPPDFLTKMIESGWLGEKSGQGFYKRAGKEKEIHAVDWKTLEYHPARKVRSPAAEEARKIEELTGRLRTLVSSHDRAGVFLWKLYRDYLLYAAGRLPEISDRVVEIDRAMRWGYAHKFGPFELWDALGFEDTARRIEREGCTLPPRVEAMLAAGAKSFYRAADASGRPSTEYFDLTASVYQEIEERPGVVELAPLRRARGVLEGNAGGSLIDLGDGVLCLELHGKSNLFGDDQIEMIHAGIKEAERNFEAMIVAGGGENFCTGTDLAQLLTCAQNRNWSEIDGFIGQLQQANMALKYSARPVIAAPYGRTSGAGFELALHSARVQASAELYAGFLETAVGLIPAGGGSKEMLLRLCDARKAFELIGMARVSGSAEEARSMGLLRIEDGVTMNPERLIADAKALALSVARGYEPGAPRKDIPVAGDRGESLMEPSAAGERETEYDLVIARKLSWVLGGPAGRRMLSEQDLLDLEREAFLSLCGNPKTQERIEHMLRTGKPLHN